MTEDERAFWDRVYCTALSVVAAEIESGGKDGFATVRAQWAADQADAALSQRRQRMKGTQDNG